MKKRVSILKVDKVVNINLYNESNGLDNYCLADVLEYIQEDKWKNVKFENEIHWLLDSVDDNTSKIVLNLSVLVCFGGWSFIPQYARKMSSHIESLHRLYIKLIHFEDIFDSITDSLKDIDNLIENDLYPPEVVSLIFMSRKELLHIEGFMKTNENVLSLDDLTTN